MLNTMMSKNHLNSESHGYGLQLDTGRDVTWGLAVHQHLREARGREFCSARFGAMKI